MDDLDAEFDQAMAGLEAAGLPDDTPDGDYSHDALALAWGAGSADTARYVDAWGWWLHWDGTRWKRDQYAHRFGRKLLCPREAAPCECANERGDATRQIAWTFHDLLRPLRRQTTAGSFNNVSPGFTRVKRTR